MILIEKTSIVGLEEAIRGMRNPMNSWDKSDSLFIEDGEYHTIQGDSGPFYGTEDEPFQIGPNDHELMIKLAKGGSVHGKFRRMIVVYVDITAPLYWWKEFDTYKVGTVANSCSTMHKIHAKEFVLEDFSHEHLVESTREVLIKLIDILNISRETFLESNCKLFWWQMIQLLPSSYNQKRTVMLNYEVLSGIYRYRKDHKVDEWRTLCGWIEGLPHSDVITCNVEG